MDRGRAPTRRHALGGLAAAIAALVACRRRGREAAMTQPVAFVSHGAPTLGIEQTGAAADLAAWGQRLARPRAVVVVSAHWVAARARTGVERTAELSYDFGGFPDELYQLRYPAPGHPELAARVRELTGAAAEGERPWDHGVWIPLLKMFPAADVPVVQVALPLRSGPDGWLALGRALAPLRHEGVLVIGSGGAVHNLRRLAWRGPAGEPEPWARGFDDWLVKVIDAGDLAALARVLDDAPEPALAHPTVEHLAPLLVAAGAAADGDRLPQARYPVTGWVMGNLSMRSVEWAA